MLAQHEARHSVYLDTAAAIDPVVFSRNAGIDPEMWQATFLRSSARQQILLCSRQAGKSTITAAMAMHQAIYVPGSLILVFAPAMRQSKELYRKMQELYVGAGEPVKTETETKLEMELSNGSRIISLPGKEGTVRGFSNAALLIVDEASRVPDEMYQAIRPMILASGGRIVLLSTPHGKRGFFHFEWTDGGSSWHRTKITAYESGRISRKDLEDERRKIPAHVFDEEYLCVFGELEDAAFAFDDIRAAIAPGLPPLFAQGHGA